MDFASDPYDANSAAGYDANLDANNSVTMYDISVDLASDRKDASPAAGYDANVDANKWDDSSPRDGLPSRNDVAPSKYRVPLPMNVRDTTEILAFHPTFTTRNDQGKYRS